MKSLSRGASSGREHRDHRVGDPSCGRGVLPGHEAPTLDVFASPSYLARRGRPRTIESLAEHECLPFVLPRSGRVLPWLFASPSAELVPHVEVLECHADRTRPFSLVYPKAPLSPHVRAVVDWIVERRLTP